MITSAVRMDNVVTWIANGVKWLYCVLIVWVAVATVYIQINALPTQIPPSLLYGMAQVRTIEDLLQMLDQTVKPVIPGQGKNTAWNLPLENKEWGPDGDDDDDDDNDDGDDDDDDDDDDSGFVGGQKPIPVPVAIVTDNRESRTKLTPLQFSDVEPLPRCIPRESVVTVLPEPSEPHVMYWPGCVTVYRCGGCCNNELVECQATRSEMVQLKVIRMEYTPRSKHNIQYDGVVAKNISNHTDCSCQCKVKPQDCNPATQVHRNCQCECKASVSCPAGKQWDPIRCQCSCSASQQERICPKVRQEWNEDTCRCTCRKDLVAKCRGQNRFNYRRCKCERGST